MSTLIVGVFAGVCGWVLWLLLRHYVVKSPIDHLPGPPRTSFLLGNFVDTMSRNNWGFLDYLLEDYPVVAKLHGILGEQSLYTTDPIAIHSILIKDNQSYEHTGEFLIGNTLLFGPGLVSTKGDIHRKQRKILTPAFSTTNLRTITPVVAQTAETLRTAIVSQVKSSSDPVDMFAWMSRAALEIIGRGGLGYSFDELVRATRNEHGDAIKAVLPTVFALALHWFFVPLTMHLGPPWFRRWLLDMYPHRTVQYLKNIVDLTYQKADNLVRQKKAALEKGELGEGKDIMSILLRANMEASSEDRLPDEQLIAQVNTMIFAATDTTSNALSRILHVLTEHPHVQGRVRQEILEVKADAGGEDISYDKLMELPWLDAICRETLRLYPPVLMLDRIVRQDTVLPLSKPIRDRHGNMINKIALPKDTSVDFSLYGYNRSKDVWGDDAFEWNPERWFSPLPESAKAIPGGTLYSNMITFSIGHRACIGFKYAELEMKVILFYLLQSLKFSKADVNIEWISSHIAYPSTSPDSAEGHMPLNVTLV